jgi:hypothetical protein
MKISSPKAINWTLKQYGYCDLSYKSSLKNVGILPHKKCVSLERKVQSTRRKTYRKMS